VKWASLLLLTYLAGAEGFALFALYLAMLLATVRFLKRFRRQPVPVTAA
jgi:hypothetical protein